MTKSDPKEPEFEDRPAPAVEPEEEDKNVSSSS